MEFQDIRFDCRWFRGDIPCQPNKLRGRECKDCPEVDAVSLRILIIKLGAAGDVIRTTPLLTRFRSEHPGCHITWVSHSPSLVPRSQVDRVLRFDFASVYSLRHQRFDVALNLDKDLEACALLSDVQAPDKRGFILEDGRLGGCNDAAREKILTGLSDARSQANTRSYLEEIFAIAGFRFAREEYILDVDPVLVARHAPLRERAGGKALVGLNTGCGVRWPTRLWPESSWVALIGQLQEHGVFPVLLGGPDEEQRNLRLQEQTGACYPGIHPLQEFAALASHCDAIVTAVSMAMHVALGLRVPLVLFNNIFNRHEFELYGRGSIVEPNSGCDCYFGPRCSRERHCMSDLQPDAVRRAVLAALAG